MIFLFQEDQPIVKTRTLFRRLTRDFGHDVIVARERWLDAQSECPELCTCVFWHVWCTVCNVTANDSHGEIWSYSPTRGWTWKYSSLSIFHGHVMLSNKPAQWVRGHVWERKPAMPSPLDPWVATIALTSIPHVMCDFSLALFHFALFAKIP